MPITNNYHQVIVYGSLREGCHNRKHIPKAISLGKIDLPYFKMFQKHFNRRLSDKFPFIIYSKNKTDKIKGEMLLLTSDELRIVQTLENQYLTIPIMIEGYEKPFLIWTQDDQYLNQSLGIGGAMVKIPFGNWLKHAKLNGYL